MQRFSDEDGMIMYCRFNVTAAGNTEEGNPDFLKNWLPRSSPLDLHAAACLAYELMELSPVAAQCWSVEKMAKALNPSSPRA